MSESSPIRAAEIDTSHLLLIVVGAHLRAEVADRPLAYRLRENICQWLQRNNGVIDVPFEPVICCDVWYLNHEPLHQRPTISVGGPGVNALTAHYYDKLNTVYVRNEQMLIQLDPDFTDLRVCVWGMNYEFMQQALEAFEHKYLNSYLRAVATQVEPKHN